jgi:1-acyl-sn-glycerol-3-phosphate acyltransferase
VLTRLGLYKLLDENPEQAWYAGRCVVKPIMRALAPSYGYGHERMPSTGGLVVAVNHFSGIDPTLVGIHSRRALYYMAKIELLSVPLAGELLRWMGAFAVRRGAGDRDSLRVARWAIDKGHALGVFAEGTRQQRGYPGPMHAGAAMLAIQAGVPLVPCGIDSFGWSLRNRRKCCVIWGEPITFDLPRNSRGYKEATAIIEERVTALWRLAAQAVADDFPERLADGSQRGRPLPTPDLLQYPELPPWPAEPWAAGPLGPVYRPYGVQTLHEGAPPGTS